MHRTLSVISRADRSGVIPVYPDIYRKTPAQLPASRDDLVTGRRSDNDSPGDSSSRWPDRISTETVRCPNVKLMAEMTGAGRAFAIKDEAQYQSVKTVADQQVLVRDRDGRAGLLPCHASQRLSEPYSGIERVVVVVHGALRDSD